MTRQMAPWLAWDMNARGTDAWGATDGVEVYRELGGIISGWHDWVKTKQWAKWKTGIFHTRAASVGKADEIWNAHPFVIDKVTGELVCGDAGDGRLVGIHNGSVSNWTELNKKYNREFKVDSIHLFANLAQGFPTREITGYGAAAWYDEGSLFLTKFNNGDLSVVKLKSGEVVFCSQYQSIVDACDMVGAEIEITYEIAGDRKYEVEVLEDGDVLWDLDVLPFGGRTGGYTTFSPASGGYNSEAGRASYGCGDTDYSGINTPPFGSGWQGGSDYSSKTKGFCRKCYKEKVNRKKLLLCDGCVKMFKEEFERAMKKEEYGFCY